MARLTKSKVEAAEELLADDRPEDIEQAQIVHGESGTLFPTSIRLSAPLMENIDRLATAQHRKRSNMIQHILWEYIRSHADDL
jgi:hypothetical protein